MIGAFELVDESGRVLAKGESGADLVKAHVEGYYRKDGTYVRPHDDSRPSAQGGSGKHGGVDPFGHPTAVGMADKLEVGETPKDAKFMHFAGKEYYATGKEGVSGHDGIELRHFREMTDDDESGEDLWLDEHGRVHADSFDEVDGLRDRYRKHIGKKQ